MIARSLGSATLLLSLAAAGSAMADTGSPGSCTIALPATDAEGRVADSPLPRMIPGAAAGTTGGLGKKLYVVTKLDDAKPSKSRPSPEGTIRWAVEAARAGGGWIAFDPALTGELHLEASLHLPSDVTLDGGCGRVEIVSPPRVTQLAISKAENIIVAGLALTKTAYDDKKDKTGDAVGITDEVDRIAILHNRFHRCGDGCVDIVRKTRFDTNSRVTVAFNEFADHNKVMLIGTLTCYSNKDAEGCDDPIAHLGGVMKPRIFVTVAANVFLGTSQRHPKVVSNAKVHVVDNFFELKPTPYSTGDDSAVYGAATGSAGILLAERNVFVNPLRSARIGIGPISAVRAANGGGTEPDGIVAADNNTVFGDVRTVQNRPEVVRSLFAEPLGAFPARLVTSSDCVRKIAGPNGRGIDRTKVCGGP